MMAHLPKPMTDARQWLHIWRTCPPLKGTTIIEGDTGTVVGYVGPAITEGPVANEPDKTASGRA